MMHIQLVLDAIVVIALAAPGVVLAQQGGIFTGASDVGKTQAGSSVYDPATKVYTITGGGADMWGAADAFHFSWVQLTGDAALTADVHFPAGPLAPLEKAVLIFRQSLDPGAAYADNAIHADGHITLQYRITAGGQTADVTLPEHGATRLRIERSGDKFTASAASADGKFTPFSTQTIVLTGPVYVGIGVCAHDAAGLATVSFANVSIERR
jgi:hypothetical protein